MGSGASISGSGYIGTGQGGITLHGDTISGDSQQKYLQVMFHKQLSSGFTISLTIQTLKYIRY